MMPAAVRSSFFVFRIRPSGFSSVSVASPRTSGITATPVSKPDRPSASFGNRMMAIAPIITGSPWRANSAAFHSITSCGWRRISCTLFITTMTFMARYRPTSPIASVIASRNPRRKIPPRTTSSRSVTMVG
jgi:hypothetical protein